MTAAATPDELAALDRLLAAAWEPTYPGAIIERLLLAWWNAEDFGGFDPVSLWGLDDKLAADALMVLSLIVRLRGYPDVLGVRYSRAFSALARHHLGVAQVPPLSMEDASQ